MIPGSIDWKGKTEKQSHGTYFNGMDNISGTNNFWIIFNMCFVGCQGHRAVEDPFVFCESRLDFMDT